MTELTELKKTLCEIIDSHKDEIIELGESIWKNPEPGFKELNTSKLVAQKFKNLKLPLKENLAVTGFRADLTSEKPGPALALLGELDSVILSGHLDASPETGAVHACGHNVGATALAGAAIGLKGIQAEKHIAGKIVFIASPAEEFLDLDYRLELCRQRKIHYCGGKAELIRLGVFDDVDAGMMIHAGDKFFYPESYNGLLMKKVTFTGKASHAGVGPDKGVNALYAANIALSAVNAQRETFRDEDSVRVHGIITNGGDSVNIIPDKIKMEIQVRAKTVAAIMDASAKVDRSLMAGAMAMGAAVKIENIPGYMPFKNESMFAGFYSENIKALDPSSELHCEGHRGASTDMGDLSQIMPAFHPYSNGCAGGHHTRDFRIADPEKAYVGSAKLLAMTALDLMYGNADACRKIASQKPPMTKEQYLELKEETFSTKSRDFSSSY